MGVKSGWQSTKIGCGPPPIETPEGWLLIYHGVLNSYTFVYSFGAALLDLNQPTVRLTIYYSGADTVKALAFAKMDEVIDFLNTNSELLAI